MTKVSVIIPVYNAAPYIEECINSVLEQDCPNVEIIAINDGSTDNSLEILQQFVGRITIINQINSGISHTRNVGIRASSGEYIAFIDSDDFWLPGKLSAQVDFLNNNPDFGATYTNNAEWKEGIDARPQDFSNEEPMILFSLSGWHVSALMTIYCIQTSTIMIRKSILSIVGLFDTTMPTGEDRDLWLRIAAKTKIHKIDGIYSVYRRNDASITNHTPYNSSQCINLEKLLNNISQTELDNNGITLTDIRHVLSDEYIDGAQELLDANLVLQSIRELALSLYNNPKNTMAYDFIAFQAWKLIPKTLRAIVQKIT